MLSVERREQFVDQLELSPTARNAVLKARMKMVDPEVLVPRSVRNREDPLPLPELPDWATSEMCPRCHSLMTPVKAKADKQWGENITFQCHNSFQGTICLLTKDVYTSNPYRMTALDFQMGDTSWKKIAAETDLIVGKFDRVDPYPFEIAPPHPWTRKTVRSIVYTLFWKMYLANKSVDKYELIENVVHKSSYERDKVSECVNNLPDWMLAHTGFVITPVQGKWEVVGKGKGNLALAPFNSFKYRSDFGFKEPVIIDDSL